MMEDIKEKIIEDAIRAVKDKFKMLDAWNVGAETGPERLVKETISEAMDKYTEQLRAERDEYKRALIAASQSLHPYAIISKILNKYK